MKHPKVTIYTDGSYLTKFHTGGYAALMVDEYQNWKLIGAGQADATISRMELSAVVNSLAYLVDGCDVTIIADSTYVVNIINKWLASWVASKYVKSDGNQVSNLDIIELLKFHIDRMHKVQACWIKSHTGYTDEQSRGNEVVDMFAVMQSKSVITTKQ